MAYQLSIFDSIPYKLQAKQLLSYVDNAGKQEQEDKDFKDLTIAYKNQDLNRLEALTKKDDIGIEGFTDLLLYKRNENWVKKLETLLSENALLVAVGAGHLPGERGVINLLKKAGYTVEPVENQMIRKPRGAKEIVAMVTH